MVATLTAVRGRRQPDDPRYIADAGKPIAIAAPEVSDIRLGKPAGLTLPV